MAHTSRRATGTSPSGRSPPRRAARATRAADGAPVAPRDWPLAVRASPASPVDTTGAGDTFTGVVAAAVAAGAGVVQAVRRGAAAAALSTEGVGARAGMPATA